MHATQIDWEDCHGKSEKTENQNQSEKGQARRRRAQAENQKGKASGQKAGPKGQGRQIQGEKIRRKEGVAAEGEDPQNPDDGRVLRVAAGLEDTVRRPLNTSGVPAPGSGAAPR